jgi:Fe-S-cluster-containing dehydrogenase component
MARILKLKDIHKCIGCYCCMQACARMWYRSFSLDRSAIQVRTSGGVQGQMMIILCMGCLEAPCTVDCPTGALEQRKGGGVLFRRELCTGCEHCVRDCPVGALSWDEALGEIIYCRHCGYCARMCPHEVLAMTPTDGGAV